MPHITLPFETWRVVIKTLREPGRPPYMREHADAIERELDRHARSDDPVPLSLSDDAYLRSFNWARLELRIPLPANRQT